MNPPIVADPVSLPANAPGTFAKAPVLLSRTLFANAQEIAIHHNGQDYRLRITRQNKLILTK